MYKHTNERVNKGIFFVTIEPKVVVCYVHVPLTH